MKGKGTDQPVLFRSISSVNNDWDMRSDNSDRTAESVMLIYAAMNNFPYFYSIMNKMNTEENTNLKSNYKGFRI